VNERQKQIIADAIPVFLKEGVTVPTARVAKAVGVSNGTLFNAFATKQELIDSIYRTTKLEMLAVLPTPDGTPFGLAQMRACWDAYLGWARAVPDSHRVMHLLRQSGFVSQAVSDEIDQLGAPQAQMLLDAWQEGIIRGPSVSFISDLIFLQIDLVIDHELTGADENLAFEMLCQTIGIS